MKVPTSKQLRSGVLFGAGLIGVGYETIIGNADRPTLLITFAAMMGLPLFLNKDEKTLSALPSPLTETPSEPKS